MVFKDLIVIKAWVLSNHFYAVNTLYKEAPWKLDLYIVFPGRQ